MSITKKNRKMISRRSMHVSVGIAAITHHSENFVRLTFLITISDDVNAVIAWLQDVVTSSPRIVCQFEKTGSAIIARLTEVGYTVH